MNNLIYDTGLIIGHFQTFHKGHQSLVDTGLQLCDRLLILVGSAQESGTERNPFDINTSNNRHSSNYIEWVSFCSTFLC